MAERADRFDDSTEPKTQLAAPKRRPPVRPGAPLVVRPHETPEMAARIDAFLAECEGLSDDQKDQKLFELKANDKELFRAVYYRETADRNAQVDAGLKASASSRIEARQLDATLIGTQAKAADVINGALVKKLKRSA